MEPRGDEMDVSAGVVVHYKVSIDAKMAMRIADAANMAVLAYMAKSEGSHKRKKKGGRWRPTAFVTEDNVWILDNDTGTCFWCAMARTDGGSYACVALGVLEQHATVRCEGDKTLLKIEEDMNK